MSDAGFERLSVRENSYLLQERPDTHMHLSAVTICEGEPLVDPEHGLDMERVRALIESRLHLVPRYRQRIERTPLRQQPVWVDENRFNLAYHVRHTALPRPGDLATLKALAGRILSQPLDRTKPLWELWFVEGLEGGRFAVISKTHQCMLQNVSSTSLVSTLLRTSPDAEIDDAPTWSPRPHPGPLELTASEVAEAGELPRATAKAMRNALRHPRRASTSFAEGAAAAWRAVTAGFEIASNTPINRAIGPHRRAEWQPVDLAEVKAIAESLGGTTNDVALAIIAGGLRRFFLKRHMQLDDVNFRVVIPVGVPSEIPDDDGDVRPSAWFVRLPLGNPDPRERLEQIAAHTGELRRGQSAEQSEILFQFAEWSGSAALNHAGTRLVAGLLPFNLVVVPMPSPGRSLYLLGSKLQGIYPQIPLIENQGLAIGLLRYAGSLAISMTADWDLVPDLGTLAAEMEHSFKELREACRARPAGDAESRAE